MSFLGLGKSEEEKARDREINKDFFPSSGGRYTSKQKAAIAGCLYDSLGCAQLDDLLEMHAPDTFQKLDVMAKNIYATCKYLDENLKPNNMMQQLQGQNEELQKRCEYQEALIRQLMEQNKALQEKLIGNPKERPHAAMSR